MWPKSWLKKESGAAICDSLHKPHWKRNHDLNKETRLLGKAGPQSEYFFKSSLLTSTMLAFTFAFAEQHLSQANHLWSDFHVFVPFDVLKSQFQS